MFREKRYLTIALASAIVAVPLVLSLVLCGALSLLGTVSLQLTCQTPPMLAR
jgi:hypothetical protein